MILWNKEKAVFAGAVALSCLVLYLAVGTLSQQTSVDYSPTKSSRGVRPPEDRAIAWYEVRTEEGARSPFEATSSWSGAPRDDLPPPVVRRLDRRIPLPATLVRSVNALPPRERKKPESKTE